MVVNCEDKCLVGGGGVGEIGQEIGQRVLLEVVRRPLVFGIIHNMMLGTLLMVQTLAQ